MSDTSSSPSLGPPEGTVRVLRGGSWVADAWVLRSSRRLWVEPEYRYNYIGFRSVREVIP